MEGLVATYVCQHPRRLENEGFDLLLARRRERGGKIASLSLRHLRSAREGLSTAAGTVSHGIDPLVRVTHCSQELVHHDLKTRQRQTNKQTDRQTNRNKQTNK